MQTTGKALTGPSLPRLTILLLALAAAVVAAYFWPLVVLALLAAALLVALTWAKPFWVFGGLLALLPLHEQMLRITTWQLGWPAGRVTLLSLWKEGIIALLFGVMIAQHLWGRRRMRLKLYQFDLWLLALILLSAAYVLVAAAPSIGLFGFRNYFEPLALLFLARLLPYSRRQLGRLLILLALVAAGVALYGIYQAQFIDFPTMIGLGYVDQYGNLPFAFKTALRDGQPRPRAISTVTGPNQLAIYLNLFILLSAYGIASRESWLAAVRRGGVTGRRLLLAALLLVYAICLLLTFSRGGLLALLASLLAWGWIILYERGIRRTWRELRQSRLRLAGLVTLAIAAGGGLVVSGFARRILRGLTGRDPAALGHVTSLDYALDFVANNPGGVGLGMAGPRALRFLGQIQIEHTESTYLQFGMETGLLGMLLLLLLLLSLLATLWRLRQRRKAQGDRQAQALTELALVIWVGALAVFTVTPLMQNFLVASYLWLTAGIAFHLDAYRDDQLRMGEAVNG